MYRQFGITLTVIIVSMLLCLPALADTPQQRGTIRDVNLQQGWVVIDTRRLMISAGTEIRNFAIGGHNQRALQKGRPVLFTANKNREMETIWIYPQNPGQNSTIDAATIELMQ